MKVERGNTKYYREILEKNKGIDQKLVKKQEELERQLKRFGVDVKPKFRLEPPLGSSKLYLYNQDK